ncbi:MAG: ABC transporter permease [Acidobacteria bacterium]|nr:ABC transporter permease [Acidobacteriota bacterium]
MLESTLRLLRFRGLLVTLVQRELKARYRGSVLGFLWSLVTPLILLAVYTFVFSFIFRPRVAGAEPYPLFLMCGLFPWVWIATSLQEGTVSLTASAGLIRKAVFPTEVLPIVAVLANLVHFLLALPVLAAGMLVGRALDFPVCGWSALGLAPIIALEFLLLGGMVLGLAALNVHFKDIKDIVANLLALLFYLTPIIYRLEGIHFPEAGWAQHLGRVVSLFVRWCNPFTPFTEAIQETLFTGSWPALTLWLHMLAWAALCWLLGTWLFHRLRDSLVEAV